MEVLFKNVGQGDSILLEWVKDGNNCYGIVDCNLYNNTNPMLDEIKRKGVTNIDFIILSHLHYDHYSGIGELLEYCINSGIPIAQFLHTFTNEYLNILDQQFLTQKQKADTEKLLENIDNALNRKVIKEIDGVSHKFIPIVLYNNVRLQFLSPNGTDELTLSKQHSQYKNKQTTKRPDFNVVSTIIEITDDKKCVLLTSDAPKNSFIRIDGKIKASAELVQVPHHGSQYNVEESFWKNLTKEVKCESIFSVGDVKKDKLPKKEVVEFFDKNGYHNVSTNFVYGLADYYSAGTVSAPTNISSAYIKTFAKPKAPATASISVMSSRFSGDQIFKISF